MEEVKVWVKHLLLSFWILFDGKGVRIWFDTVLSLCAENKRSDIEKRQAVDLTQWVKHAVQTWKSDLGSQKPQIKIEHGKVFL